MLRAVARPVALAARAVKPSTAARALSTSAVRRSEHHVEPALFAPGAKAGEVATNDVHATGLERLQVLAEMHGVKVFDYDPLDSSRVGTLADPIKVFSFVCIPSSLALYSRLYELMLMSWIWPFSGH